MDKKKQLLILRDEIIDEIYKKRWEEVWFFPIFKEIPEVQGWQGTGPVMFVSINPSFGSYPSRADIFYYRNLRKQGFANAHLTDLYKIKNRNKDIKTLFADSQLLDEAIKYMDKEIRIIQPKLIVGVGTSYRKLYESIFKKYKISLEYIPHYAPQFNNDRREKLFRKKMRELAKKYKNVPIL